MKERKRFSEECAAKREEIKEAKKNKRGQIALDNLNTARRNAMGGGMMGSFPGGMGEMNGAGTISNFPNPWQNQQQQQFASNMMQMMSMMMSGRTPN